MEDIGYEFLLDIALMLLGTKLLGMVTRKLNMPQVVGALLAGLILGPACLNLLQSTDFIVQMSEIGVIVLMFSAGLETDVKELKSCGAASTVIALFGVVLPLAGGALLAHFSLGGENLLQNIFVGVVLTATSVSITVETLKEMGKLNTKVSNTILGAAIIDDVLGIVVLTVISSLAGGDASIGMVLLKVLLFFVFSGVVGFIFFKLFTIWFSQSKKDLRRYVIVAFVFCVLLSYIAEEFFGVADITGAFVAGLILSSTKECHYITARFETMSYLLLSPIFFASVGINASFDAMTSNIVVFTVLLVIVAILTKIVGCYIGARMFKFTSKESTQIGTGMVSRGEVALIVANKGQALGLVQQAIFAPIVIMVVITTIVSPVLLKLAFKDKDSHKPTKEEKLEQKQAEKHRVGVDSYTGQSLDILEPSV